MTYMIALVFWWLVVVVVAIVAIILYGAYHGVTSWWRVRVLKAPYKYGDCDNADLVEVLVLTFAILIIPPALYTLIVYLFF